MSSNKEIIKSILSKGPRTDLSNEFSKASGVALLLCGTEDELEVLFIKRALNPKDHWSGHLAFPGGKMEPSDPSLLAACIREVFEEVGLRLTEDQLLGCLDDIQARRRSHQLEFYVRPFVFYIDQKPDFVLQSYEVEKVSWVPLSYLRNASHQTEYHLNYEEVSLSLPGIRFPEGDILWGLTYLMVQNFLSKLAPALKP